MAELHLKRGPDSAAALRRVKFRVDGTVVARLRPFESATVEVAPGRHTVRAEMDWISSASLPVTVSADVPTELVASLTWPALFFGAYLRPRRALKLIAPT